MSKKTEVVLVASGVQGSGKTTILRLIFAHLSAHGYKVILSEGSNTLTILDAKPKHSF